ncbi:hypothetical protein BVY04_02135 [bacterium M21]|nr:hypothetical protein BVY04_02135 [bacterium M21]
MPFFNRHREIDRLARALNSGHPGFMVVYGRRRCGKSRLLQHTMRPGDIYSLADQREERLQIQATAGDIDRIIPGFAEADYPSWESLFNTLNERAKEGMALVLDEFPYLVQSCSALPSLVQKFIDNPSRRIHLVICGSSQRMMHGLVLDAVAPLYGRADEILKIQPLESGWIMDAIEGDSISAIEHYSILGGVPRYWELASPFASLGVIVKELILDRNGVLHREPSRILFDDVRTIAQASSILSLIANGCHRLSEIGSRLGKPVSSLTRPVATLIELGYVRKEQPFGENPKSSKKSLYKIDDPFLLFWYRHVSPNQSLLEADLIEPVMDVVLQRLPEHVSEVWEVLAQRSVPCLSIEGYQWKTAQRWWGKGTNGKQMELDLVAESFDGTALLIGEVKWEKTTNLQRVTEKLNESIANFPLVKGKKVIPVVWLKQGDSRKAEPDVHVVTPADALAVLR